MKIDVDRLAAIIRTNLNADTRDGPSCREIIALARVGAAAVECRKHDDTGHISNAGIDAEEHLFEETTKYLSAHPEGAPQ